MRTTETIRLTLELEDDEISVFSGLFYKLKYEPVKIGLAKSQITEDEQLLIDNMCEYFKTDTVE